MKKLHLLPVILGFIVFTGCNFSKGAKTDLITGLSYNYNGFGVRDVLLIDAANKVMKSNKVQLNTRMAIVVTGLTNYTLKDGKVFPGMMILVTDKKGTPVINAADLFEGTEGYEPEKASELRGYLTIAKPIVAGKTYHVKMRIWDKVKPESEINAEVDLVIE